MALFLFVCFGKSLHFVHLFIMCLIQFLKSTVFESRTYSFFLWLYTKWWILALFLPRNAAQCYSFLVKGRTLTECALNLPCLFHGKSSFSILEAELKTNSPLCRHMNTMLGILWSATDFKAYRLQGPPVGSAVTSSLYLFQSPEYLMEIQFMSYYLLHFIFSSNLSTRCFFR